MKKNFLKNKKTKQNKKIKKTFFLLNKKKPKKI